MLASSGTALVRATMYISDVNFIPFAENVLTDSSCSSLIPILLRKRFVVLADQTVLVSFCTQPEYRQEQMEMHIQIISIFVEVYEDEHGKTFAQSMYQSCSNLPERDRKEVDFNPYFSCWCSTFEELTSSSSHTHTHTPWLSCSPKFQTTHEKSCFLNIQFLIVKF